MVLRFPSCSPRRRIRLVTVIRGLKVCLCPVGPTRLRELNTSNGCQNHTTSPSAAASSQPKGFDGPSAVRLRTIRQLTGLVDPPCHPLASPDAAASTASRPASVTIASRPSCRDETARLSELIWVRREAKFFYKQDWTAQISLIPHANFVFPRASDSWFDAFS
jgi:hypothetical protein